MADNRSIEHKLETKSISKDKQPSSFGIQHFASENGKLHTALFPFLHNKSLATLSETSKTFNRISTDALEERVLTQLILFLNSPDVLGKTYITENVTSYGSGHDQVVLRTWKESVIRFPTQDEIDSILNSKNSVTVKLNNLKPLIAIPIRLYLVDLKNHFNQLNRVAYPNLAPIEPIPLSLNHLLQTRAIFDRLGLTLDFYLTHVVKLLNDSFIHHIWHHEYKEDPQPLKTLLNKFQTRGLTLEEPFLPQLMERFKETVSHVDIEHRETTLENTITKLKRILIFLATQGMPLDRFHNIPYLNYGAIPKIIWSTRELNVPIAPFFPLINLSLELGANFNAVDHNGNPVFFTMSEIHEETAVQMLEHYREYIDINARNSDNKTAVMLAAERGHLILLKKLIEAGADVTLTNWNNYTASILADRSNLITGEERQKVQQLLAAAKPICTEGDEWEMIATPYSRR